MRSLLRECPPQATLHCSLKLWEQKWPSKTREYPEKLKDWLNWWCPFSSFPFHWTAVKCSSFQKHHSRASQPYFALVLYPTTYLHVFWWLFLASVCLEVIGKSLGETQMHFVPCVWWQYCSEFQPIQHPLTLASTFCFSRNFMLVSWSLLSLVLFSHP